jgi:S-adenosylmethionine:tRNA-ribosyltransferase-isomerase (queuine synthetase)
MIVNDKEYEVNSEQEFISLIKGLNGNTNPLECQHEVRCNKDEYNIVLEYGVKEIREQFERIKNLPSIPLDDVVHTKDSDKKSDRYTAVFLKELGFIKLYDDIQLTMKLYEKELNQHVKKYKNGQ